MKVVMLHLTNKISTMTVDQTNIKKKNKLLMAADRKFQIEAAVVKLANPICICSVTMNYKVLHLVQDLLSVFKPNGQPLVLVYLDVVAYVAAAAVVVVEAAMVVVEARAEEVFMEKLQCATPEGLVFSTME